MLIAIISTLISSIALVGVAMSLLLQARQLRSSQIQAARASQVELIRFILDNPAMSGEGAGDLDFYKRGVVRNWMVSHLALIYENRAVPRSYLRHMAASMFEDEISRNWWSLHGYTYADGATSRRDKEFFAIVDGEFQRISREYESAKASDAAADASTISPQPSS